MSLSVKQAVIGGTGVYQLDNFDNIRLVSTERISTGYGDVEVQIVDINGELNAFICRHGSGHSVPPHKINYRANIRALKQLGVERVIATNAVGGIASDTGPGKLIVPDQIIDYTWGRAHTFFDDFNSGVSHVDFTQPFSSRLVDSLRASMSALNIDFTDGGVYGCVQGPRLETAAEIRRYENDGCTVVGMTVMPEAALVRELEMEYASLCFSVNWAAGIPVDGKPAMIEWEEIKQNIEKCAESLKKVLVRTLSESTRV